MKASAVYLVGGIMAASTSSDPICQMALDVMMVQDTTKSYGDPLNTMKELMPQLFNEVNKVNPKSQFGVVSFRDKPFQPMGERDDYCHKLEASLSFDPSKLQAAYRAMNADGGYDGPENQWQAVLETSVSKTVGWRKFGVDEKGVRVIVLLTDWTAHEEGSWKSAADQGFVLPDFKKYPQNPENHQSRDLCLYYDYPNVDTIREIVAKQDVNIITVLPNWAKTKKPEVYNYWVNIYKNVIHQPVEWITVAEANYSNVIPVLKKTLLDLTNYRCTLTTTTPPSTTTSTVAKTTTSTVAKTTTTSPVVSDSTSSDPEGPVYC